MQYYRVALRLSSRTTDHPEDVLQGLERAQKACMQLEGEYRDFLLKRISEEGFDLNATSLRFRQSLGILFGDADVYHQQPRRFYFPGLPQIQFYERSDFEWVESIEAATDEIRSELLRVLEDTSRFSPYLESDGTHLSPSGTDLVARLRSVRSRRRRNPISPGRPRSRSSRGCGRIPGYRRTTAW
jgi:hypothetical protein